METSFFNNPIVVILGVILLLPVALKVLEQAIPLIRDRVAAILPILNGWMQHTFRWAGRLVTDDGELSPPQAVAQTAGAIFMIASAVVYTVCEFQFAWATLCPMFGGECTGEVFAGYDRLLGFTTILLAVGFGLVAADLCKVTFTTHFARTQRARLFFLGIAVLGCVLSILVGGIMAWYRDLILGMGQTGVPVAETTASLQSLQTVILVSLAALLFIGALFAFMNFDTFFSAMLAGLAVVSGLVLGIVYLLMAMTNLVAAIGLVVVKAVQETLAPLTKTCQEGVRNVKAGGSTVWAKLRGLVAPRGSAKSVTKDKKEVLATLSSEQGMGGGTSQVEKQAGEQTVNGYAAHA